MGYKDRILIQTVTCITIVALLNGTGITNSDKVLNAKKIIKEEINKEYTIDDIKKIGNYIMTIPDSFNKVILTANQLSNSSSPIDEFSDEKIKKVRATSGGQVIYTGIDKELGICIRIKNANKIYTYGNLSTINVITGDRVIKSEIIGTYDSESNKELYYQLEDNMV